MKPTLLVIELHHLGDGVLAIPFMKAATKHFQVSVLCTSSVSEMLKTFCPEVEVVIAANGWSNRWHQAKTELRARQFSTTVCAWADARCHRLAKLTGARRRLGFPTNRQNFYAIHLAWRRRRLLAGQAMEQIARWVGAPYLTGELSRNDSQAPHLQNWTQLAEHLGLPYSLETPWFSTSSSPGADSTSRAGWVLHAGGRLPTKRWPIERYQKLLEQYFAPRGIPVVVIQPPGEEAPQPIGSGQTLVQCRTHAELAETISRAEFYLGNDSYAAHVAAALGKKVVTIFGSGNPDWFAPYGQRDGVCASSICPHHPCIDRCVMPDYICLKDVKPEDVAQKLAQVQA